MKIRMILSRWLPAILLMMAIFIFSSIPAKEMPSFGFWDTLVKKGGHAIGYGMLALMYWFALKWEKKRLWLAFLMAVLYALLDEFHQSFVPGRHPSLVDALVIDTGGTLVALAGMWWVRQKK
jgi:VanZ family protein